MIAVFGDDPRRYSLLTSEFRGVDGHVKSLVTHDVEIVDGVIQKVKNSEKEWNADLVILAMGFVSPEQTIAKSLSLDVDQRNNIHAEYGDYRTNVEGVFAAGDCRRGQSLVVWAINEGRGAADQCNKFLIHKAKSSSIEEDMFLN